MPSTIEAKREKLVAKAMARVEELSNSVERAIAERVIAAFYQNVPPTDIVERSPRDLFAAALSLTHLASRRQPGRAKIRVYNPDPAIDGWSSPHTIIEIVNDDMPFLVDSVTGAINAGDRVVHLVIHPILTVTRDAQGRLLEVRDAGAEGIRKSWMQIQISSEQDRDDLARLAQNLAAVLADVRAAVADWQPMRQTLRAILDELFSPPAPPVPLTALVEVQDFLRWLDDDNFTFLGYREYTFAEIAKPVRPPLGILRDEAYPVLGGLRDLASLPRDVQDFIRRRELLVVTKSNLRATIHRNAHMDAIGLRRFGPDGEIVGICLFLGLFTSLAYSRNPRTIPLLRLKVRHVLERSGFSANSHDGKALLNILDTLPRDELFQADENQLFETAISILNLQERQRIALFVRQDPLERFVSCLVYAPRDRYDTELRQRFAAILEEAFAGRVSTFYTHLDELVLARVHFIIRTTRGAIPKADVAAVEQQLAEAGRSWTDRLEEAALEAFGESETRSRLRRIRSFPVAYQARTDAAQAIADLRQIGSVQGGSPLEVSLHPVAAERATGLRLYRADTPVALSDILPLLENFGLRVVSEEPYRIDCSETASVWIHEFLLDGAVGASAGYLSGRELFEEALVMVWTGKVENDGLNRLVLAASLSARQITALRLYAKVLHQAGITFSQAYMEAALAAHPEIARRLVRLFELRFDPDGGNDRSLPVIAEIQAIDHALDEVANLDEDRILRGFLTLMVKTVRTNYFQRLPSGDPKPYLSVKLGSAELDLLPSPRPLFEIYVYSPRVEAVHMRSGLIARGGIRWSDRKEDFRTEVLGLIKAQNVKNAIILPVGAKGGFVVKQPPASRDAVGPEAVECYKILIRGLLDLTDNLVPDDTERHRVVPPPRVVRYDGDDPYLVVAADKGTATFSDYANAIAEAYGFWLGDAFASGGLAGYDHKRIGITSRGAWELVRRHFRELGRDADVDELSVIGVGDMSGDVFGNGMLRSPHLKLLGAFNHQHIFIDPAPDPQRSFAERRRLFELPHSSWTDYERGLISPGGGVFERSAKSVPISPQMKRIFDIEADRLTPAELIRKLLAVPVDLLWLAGIGTFVKASNETHAEVGDRGDDAVRINADEIRAKVVGEGANLGVTQRARVAYALAGGRIDTDAIDNSAGVDMSDHEVNIKILVDRAIAAGAIPADERAPLLTGMTEEVAALVLRDNYLQGQALSVAEARGFAALDSEVRMIRELERSGRLDRALEFLPDDETIAERVAHRVGLVRPELGILLAYAKLALSRELLASDLPDVPELVGELHGYFPATLRRRLGGMIESHPLRRELIATVVTNNLVNYAGMTFAHDMRALTGRTTTEAARAYLIVRNGFGLRGWWSAIEALDNKVTAAVQTEMLIEIATLIERAAGRLLRGGPLEFGREIARLTTAVGSLANILPGLLQPRDREILAERSRRLASANVPEPLATRVAGQIFLASTPEISDLAERSDQPLALAARVYFAVANRFALNEMRAAARRLPAETAWQKAAVETTVEEVEALHSALTARILSSEKLPEPDPLAGWIARHARMLAPAMSIIEELRATSAPDLAMLVVAARRLREALGQAESSDLAA